MNTPASILPSLGCVFGFITPGTTGLTALSALKIARRRLRPDVRSKLLSIASSRTNTTFVPEAWRFVFLDEATTGRCRVVKVAAQGSSEHPDTVSAFNSIKLEIVESMEPIPQAKLLLDSDALLKKVREISKLKGVLSAEYRLSQSRTNRQPTWQLFFYADALEPVASFQVAAKTGMVSLSKETL